MKEIKPRKIKIVLRRSPAMVKVLLCLVVMFSLTALLALYWVHTGLTAQTDALRADAAVLEYENGELNHRIGNIGSVEVIADIAQEQLGLVDPNSIIVDPE